MSEYYGFENVVAAESVAFNRHFYSCGICCGEITMNGILLHYCNHSFHYECLKTHVASVNNCPICGVMLDPGFIDAFEPIDTTPPIATSTATTADAVTVDGAATFPVCVVCGTGIADKGKSPAYCDHQFHEQCYQEHASMFNNCLVCGIVMNPVWFEDFEERATNRFLLMFGHRLKSRNCKMFRSTQLYTAILNSYGGDHYQQELTRIISAKLIIDNGPEPLETRDPKYLHTVMIVNRRYQELREKFISEEPHWECIDESF